MSLLEVEDLRTSLFAEAGEGRPVDGVSFRLEAGGTLGLVGESGCGKTMTALSILRLLPPGVRITGGAVRFAGRDLLALGSQALRDLRGKEIAMIFQEPMAALNPLFTVGNQIGEAIQAHEKVTREALRARTLELLRLVEIPEPEARLRAYPHELSGGMRQRVMIAIALACRPKLLIADEPTTALDVTIQAQILDLLQELQRRFGMALLLVTHDLGIVAERCDHVAVMYAGRLIEQGPVTEVFARPLHPYTRGLLRSLPRLGAERRRRLEPIPGRVPDLYHMPSGCRFRDRCPLAVPACAEAPPPLESFGGDHWVACLRAGENDAARTEARPGWPS